MSKTVVYDISTDGSGDTDLCIHYTAATARNTTPGNLRTLRLLSLTPNGLAFILRARRTDPRVVGPNVKPKLGCTAPMMTPNTER